MSPERTTCKANDFFESLKQEHHFRRDKVEDIKVKLNCGMSLILDLKAEEVYRYDELNKIHIKSEVVRRAAGATPDDISKRNEQIEKLVNEHLFKK